MATLIRAAAVGIGLFLVAAALAAEKNSAGVPKSAVDALLAQLDGISHDADMTTARKAAAAGVAMEKFNQQYGGKPLTVRLKVQDVVPYAQGHYFKADHPDLEGVGFFISKFHSNLPPAEAMAVTKDSVLAVTGLVNVTTQPQSYIRLDILKPGSRLAFPLRANSACRICLDNVTYQLEAAAKDKPDAAPAGTAADGDATLFPSAKTGSLSALAEKTRNEQSRSVDDVKSFFLKGIAQAQHPYGSSGSSTAGKTASGPSSGLNIHPGSGYGSGTGSGYGAGAGSGSAAAKAKHNHIYTAAEIIQKFGTPTSRTSTTTQEQWVYKCKDGVVHVHFNEVVYPGSSSASKPEKLRLEIKSVDSTSSTSVGGSRF